MTVRAPKYILVSELPIILAMIGNGYPDMRIYPYEEPDSRSSGNPPVIAADLELDPCQRYDSQGQDERQPV